MEVQPSGAEAISEGVEEWDDIGGDCFVTQVKGETAVWREVPQAIWCRSFRP